jgi:DNA (cytosine-5)-methyltransferase 1
VNGLALCAGIGGLELGLKLVCPSYTTICYVEREAYNVACLVKRMGEGWLDKAPIWDDIETFNGKPWCGKVDIVTAGYPCQPFSTAAHGKNTDTALLWPHLKRIITECSPTGVFLENVLTKAFYEPYRDLQRMGFQISYPFCCTASELGAPHIRRRFFIYAHKNSQPRLQINVETSRSKKIQGGFWRNLPRDLGMDDGVPSRLDRLRALGNAVVPAMAATAFVELTKES